MGTSTRLGPTPHPGLGGGGPAAWTCFSVIPRRPNLLLAQLGWLSRRVAGAGLPLTTQEVGDAGLGAAGVWILGPPLSALKPTYLSQHGGAECSKANAPLVAKSQRGHTEGLTSAKAISHSSNFSQFSSFPATCSSVHPCP